VAREGADTKASRPARARDLADGHTRRTLILREDQLEALDALAWIDRRQISELAREAVADYLTRRRDRVEEARTLIQRASASRDAADEGSRRE
jgi:hypothetical protein